jgi:hypothetical protein
MPLSGATSGEIVLFSGTPPLPPPFERLAGRGVHKKCLQNLEGRGVRGQNPENKRVKAVVVSLAYTAFASVMVS